MTMPRRVGLLLALLLVAAAVWAVLRPFSPLLPDTSERSELSGATMGTYWRVTVAASMSPEQKAQMHASIVQVLAAVDQAMSHWRTDSEVSTFNRTEVGQWLSVSEPLWQLLQRSRQLSRQTHSAFDITIGELVNLWGFGPDESGARPPAMAEVERALQLTGWQKLQLRPGQARRINGFSLDLSAIAKGYAVDHVSAQLLQLGYQNHLVDIGGELKVAGSRYGQAWQLAIAKPEIHSQSQPPLMLQRVQQADEGEPLWALATSGDYRNFYRWQGERYPHLLNPQTGMPVHHTLTSVSVAMPSCADADALATALLVMGAEKAMHWAEEHEIAALLIQASPVPVLNGVEGQEVWDGFLLHRTSQWQLLFASKSH